MAFLTVNAVSPQGWRLWAVNVAVTEGEEKAAPGGIRGCPAGALEQCFSMGIFFREPVKKALGKML
jgi:hypothetical protein